MKWVILLDYDGVLVQTEAQNIRLWKEMFAKYEIQYSNWDISCLMGSSYETRPVIMDEHFGSQENYKKNRQEIVYPERKFMKMDIAELATPNLYTFLSGLKERNLMTCICTNNSPERVRNSLQALNVNLFIDEITGAGWGHAKPDPFVYQQGMKIMKAKAEECLVLEDSPAGIEAGINAGIFTVALQDPFGVADTSHANLVIHDLLELLTFIDCHKKN